MRKEIAFLAGPKEWGDTRESWLNRVIDKVPTVTFRTVKALWYGEITNADHWAARDIRRAAELLQAKRKASELAAQFETIARGLSVTDAPFHQPDVAVYLDLARKLRGEA